MRLRPDIKTERDTYAPFHGTLASDVYETVKRSLTP